MEESTERRRAPGVAVLSIGVGSFDEGSDVEDLGFVPARLDEMTRAFVRLGAEVERSLDPTEREIEALLRERLVDEPGSLDVLVVHLIGHGKVDRGHRLSFVARDNREVDVDHWISRAQREVERGGHGRRVVFLVDTCSAGAATGRQPFTELDVDRGVWALGACVSDSPTEQGKFSSWVAAALHRLADRDFNLDEEAITFSRFVRELIRVSRSDPADRRVSLGFSVEQGDADWPFLPNPRTVTLTSEEIQLRRRSLGHVPGEGDLAVQPGSAHHVDDARYFADRASGRGLVPTDTGVGFFSGRAAELGRYVEWVSGAGRLLTVTGAAGAGKSGLLGVIVCSADPGLRRRFRELWESAGIELPEVPGIIAVHARQRSAQQVIDAIAGLAGVAGPSAGVDGRTGGSPPRSWGTTELRAALEREQRQRLVVLDAVDESTEPQAVLRVVADLLAPPRETDGSVPPPCRILLGGRREVVTALSALEHVADIEAAHIDLDTAERRTVEQDVRHYVQRMLTTREPYATGPPAEFVDLLAKRGAQRIARDPRPNGPWGPFLLAGLYVHYLLTLKHPPQDEAGADAYAKSASADLPALLESILKTRRHDFPALRAVLAVLARSRGEGMPRTVLRRCLKALDADGIDDEQFRDTLWEASPFLRYGADPQSGETLYRLFHQGLADYLREHPVSEDPLDGAESLDVERRLLSELVGPFTSDSDEDPWEAAEDEPYVLRHALGHAARADSVPHAESLLTDPYFLIRFDLREDHRAMDLVRSERARECLRLLTASWTTHARLRSASDRASVFSFDADRLSLRELRESFGRIARQVAVRPEEATYSLLWSEGGQVAAGSRFIESTSGSQVMDLSFSPDGTLLAAATVRGVQLVETETWRSVAPPFGRVWDGITTVAFSPDGRLLAFGRETFTRSVQLWDVHHRVLCGPPWPGRTGTPTAMAFSPDSRWLAVGSREHGVSVWDVTGDRPVERARREPGEHVRDIEKVSDVAFSPDGRLLAVCGTAGVTLWEPEHDRWTSLSENSVVAVEFSPDGLLLAVTGLDGVALHSVEKLTTVRNVDLEYANGRTLAFTPDGSLLIVGSLGSLTIVDVSSATVVNRLPVSGRRLTAVGVHPTSPVLVSGDGDGQLRLWKDFTQKAETPSLAQFGAGRVVGSPTGRFIAVHDGENRLLTLRDPATGEKVADHPLTAAASGLFFSPDGRMLAAVAHGRLDVFRTGSGPLSKAGTVRCDGYRTAEPSLVFSPDSRLIGMALEERSNTYVLMVWEAETLRLCARIPLAGSPRSFGFAGPDRIHAVVNGAIGTYGLTLPDPEAPSA
ncbi:caspase family protein [Streptomyces sp. NPDC002888]|uniref:caspase family protein n=1 Tax=Streptomyces sp. NPDC002888 TaxID=3364668 RepID=UPI0036856AD1